MESKKKTNKKFIIVIGALMIVGIVYGVYKYLYSRSHETTDDAQVNSKMNSIIPHVGGYIDTIYVKDNQMVKAGDTLLIIDQRDYLVQLEQAKANLAAAKGQIGVAEYSTGSSAANANASYAQASSTYGGIESAKIQLRRATDDYNRYKNLYESRSITTQQYEQALAAKQEAEARLSSLKDQQQAARSQSKAASSQKEATEKQINVAEAHLQSAQAQLEAAQLNLDYTVVTAPIDGQLSAISMQDGQFVQAAQQLFYLVDIHKKWIVANFKETQLSKMKVGQKVTITVDAYPDEEYEGVISNFSPATGARFSLLPPDNATGNFVKTVQRLPVQIDFTEANDHKKMELLRSGMNAEIDVHLK